jgi:hypothetical protein
MPFPASGNVITFGAHHVYMATVAPPRYPRHVRSCVGPPRGAGIGHGTASPCVVQEVMDTGDNATKSARNRCPVLERNTNADGTSGSAPPPPPPPSKLEAARAKLSTPITTGTDPSTLEADLEAHRLLLL